MSQNLQRMIVADPQDKSRFLEAMFPQDITLDEWELFRAVLNSYVRMFIRDPERMARYPAKVTVDQPDADAPTPD